MLSRKEKVVLHYHDFLCLLHKGKLGHNKMRTVFKSTFQSKIVLTAILTISPPKKTQKQLKLTTKYCFTLTLSGVKPTKNP